MRKATKRKQASQARAVSRSQNITGAPGTTTLVNAALSKTARATTLPISINNTLSQAAQSFAIGPRRPLCISNSASPIRPGCEFSEIGSLQMPMQLSPPLQDTADLADSMRHSVAQNESFLEIDEALCDSAQDKENINHNLRTVFDYQQKLSRLKDNGLSANAHTLDGKRRRYGATATLKTVSTSNYFKSVVPRFCMASRI